MKKLFVALLLIGCVSAQDLYILNKDKIRVIGDEEINISEIVELKDENARIMSIDDERGNLKIIGINEEGETDVKTVIYERIKEEDWNEYVMSVSRFASLKKRENEELLDNKGPANIDAIELALKYIGMKGSCDKVAQAFITDFLGKGYSIYSTEKIAKEDARAGDVIFYEDGGVGLQHWAVYLGGNSALQGNINGTTVIGSVYMNYGSEPQFLRSISNS